MTRRTISDKLLKRYLNGTCTPQEEVFVREWYQSFSPGQDNVPAFNDAEKLQLRNRMFAQISQQVARGNYAVKPRAIKLSRIAYTIAAVAAVLLVIILPLVVNKRPAPASQVQLITVTNKSKSIYEHTLSDGSHIWLNPGTKISYYSNFGQLTRQISMSGESFFEVTKNPKKPFSIQCDHITTKVWGTSFRVRDLKADAEVAVVTGKVSVTLSHPSLIQTHKPVMLYPDQQVVYSTKANALVTNKKRDVKSMLIWKKSALNFDNVAVKNVIPDLDREFGINIITTNKMLNEYFVTADFKGLNFPELMDVLRTTLNITYEIKGNNILLIKS